MTIAYIAFQYDTAASDTSKTWNDLLDETASGAIADIKDENNVTTGWDLDVGTGADGAFDAGVNDAGSGAASWVDEAVISDEYHYVDTTTASFSINGLNNSKTYDIELYGSRDGAGTRRTEFSYDGFETVHGTANWYGNNSATVTLAGISPETGTITISWRKLSGDAFGYLNAVKITENTTVTYQDVEVTGTPATHSSSSNGSFSVTIPSDAEAVVVCVSGHCTNTGLLCDVLNFDAGSTQDFADTGYEYWATTTNVSFYIMTSESVDWPGTGAKTLTFEGDGTIGEGLNLVAFCVKGIDVDDPLGATDSDTGVSVSEPWTSSLGTVKDEDLCIIATYAYANSITPPTGEGQTNIANIGPQQSVCLCVESELGESALVSGSETYTTPIAFVLNAAAVTRYPYEIHKYKRGGINVLLTQ